MSTISPNMNLVISTINVDSGLAWETNLNSSLSIIDQHNHTSGYGVQIPSAGININSDLSFQNFQATDLKATVFSVQTSVSTLDSLYVKGVDLYFNDGSSNAIQITAGGLVNATSSGIASGAATASFVSSVLVVNAAATTPANIQAGSILLGNNVALSKFLTLAPPSAMAANFTLTLPTVPAANSFMTIDTSGNMGATALLGALTTSNLSATAGILGTQIAAATIAAANITSGTLTGTQMASSINLPGRAVEEAGSMLAVSHTNASASLAIMRGLVGSTGTTISGEGFTTVHTGTGVYTISFNSDFTDQPAIVGTVSAANNIVTWSTGSILASGFVMYTFNAGGASDQAFSFIAIGVRQ